MNLLSSIPSADAGMICDTIKSMDLSVTIVYQQDEEGWWIAEIPEIPGAFSQGKTQDEAREMVLDAANELPIVRRERALQQVGIKSETLKLAG